MTRLFALGTGALIVAADQLIKRWALYSLGAPIPVIPGLFYLTYVENRGAAFGIFQGQPIPLAIVTGIALLAAIIAVLTGYVRGKYMTWCICIVIAGGVGNCIDRFTRQFVVDYLDFSALFDFPVFNLADCCIVIGTSLILFWILFLERKNPDGKPDDTPDSTPDSAGEA